MGAKQVCGESVDYNETVPERCVQRSGSKAGDVLIQISSTYEICDSSLWKRTRQFSRRTRTRTRTAQGHLVTFSSAPDNIIKRVSFKRKKLNEGMVLLG